MCQRHSRVANSARFVGVIVTAIGVWLCIVLIALWFSPVSEASVVGRPSSCRATQASIIIHVQFGLANRLRALASAMVIANVTGRSLHIVWPQDDHCSCAFEELFTVSALCVTTALRVQSTLRETIQYDYMANHKGLLIETDTEKDIYVKSAFRLRHSSVNTASLSWVLRSLIRPAADLWVEARSALIAMRQCRAVGVHVRSLAPDAELSSTNYTNKEALVKLRQYRAGCKARSFLQSLGNLSVDPSVCFFVASDDVNEISVLKARFREKVFHQAKSCSERTPQCLRTAVVDLYVLAGTTQLVGSEFSSFTEVAHLLSNRKPLAYGCS